MSRLQDPDDQKHLIIRAYCIKAGALLLNAGIEVCDMVAGGLEVRERGTRDPIAVGGMLVPLLGLATWLTALVELKRRTGVEPATSS